MIKVVNEVVIDMVNEVLIDIVVNEVVIDVVVNEVVVMDEVVGIWMVLDWYGYQEKDKNKDNTRQSRARD
ncbi:hypothetical protein Tco_0322237 [Tanacetum coccineum]